MRGRQSFFGCIMLEITSADLVALLNKLNDSGVHLCDLDYCGILDLRVVIYKRDLKKLQQLAEKQGASIKIISQSGVNLWASALKKRPVLLALFGIILFLTLFLPSRVLFINVEGNSSISNNQIIEAVNDCGIKFGTPRRILRSEEMKNALLQELPQLKWAGINTYGCNAIVSVQESAITQTEEPKENSVSSIVAARDGIIQDCTVYRGNLLCTVGQAVKAGQTLVSGYMDYGIFTQATGADAEINAVTFRKLEVISPASTQTRGKLSKITTRYGLQIGKILINLRKDSGNLDTSCVKIYSENFLTLPGGFQLPVAIVEERCYYYEDSRETTTAVEDTGWLNQFAQAYLKSTMISGQVISDQGEISKDTDGCYLSGKYACLEMIGKVKYEQTMIKDEMYD